ncbi:reticulocyte-binding protein 2 (RBP2), like [Plasmodium vivax Mauritania I]|uniref:Reticulocyte-binding protein 2 (RBP2), like n=1 Tax=Plasmodium vivax Mauritania I TaxID=1035515 RepID=A0A0J9T4L9_PLAVI|nr:reticulocyte-binding protein 2 (RBP2), like [Plasmodium vivax Mauritania I]
MSPDKDGYKGAEKDDKANNHNDNNNGNNNDNNNNSDNNDENSNNSENLRTSNLQNSSSVGHLNNHEDTTKPSHYSYLKKSNIYAPDAKNNKMEDDNKKLHTVSNSFIQNSKQAQNIIATNNLDYISAIDDYNNIISSFQPYHASVYYLNELKYYATHYNELKVLVQKDVIPQVTHITNIVEKNVKICLEKTHELNTLITQLENPQTYNIQRSHYSNRVKDYRKKIEDIQNCLKLNYKRNVKATVFATIIWFQTLIKMECSWWTKSCSTRIYYNMIKMYTLKIKEYKIKKPTAYMDKIKAVYKLANDTIWRIKVELNSNLDSDTTDFILEEFKYIIEKYNGHIDKINLGTSYIDHIHEQEGTLNNTKIEIITLYSVIANRYTAFKFSLEHINMFENTSKSKEQVLYNSFSKFEDRLQKKINDLINSEFSISTVNSVILDSEKNIQLSESLLNSSSKEIAQHEIKLNAEIEKKKKDYDQKIIRARETIKKSKELITSVKNAFKLSLEEKEKIEKKVTEAKKLPNALERDKAYLDIMSEIRKIKNKLSDNARKTTEFTKKSNALKKEVQELNTSVNNYVQAIKEQKEKEIRNNSLKDEIKKFLEYIPNNREKIKELITKKNEVQQYIPKIEELIKDAHFGVEEFTAKKTELQNQVNSIIDAFYKEDLQLFLDNLSKSYDENQVLEKEADTTEKIEELHKRTKMDYEKLLNMKCDDIPEIIKKLNTELNNLKNLEKNIVEEQTKNINKYVSDSFDNLTDEMNRLRNSLNEYKQDEGKLQTYKGSINERKDKFLNTSSEKEEDIPEGQNIYDEYKSHKDLMVNKELKLSSDINEFKENIKKVQTKIEAFSSVMQKLGANADEQHQETINSLKNFNTKIEGLKLSELEGEFKINNESAAKLYNQIENTMKNIDTIKSLNYTRNSANNSRELMEKIVKDKNDLIKKLDQQSEEIKQYTLIEEEEKSPLLSALNEEQNHVESEIPKESIDKLNTEINDILEYYNSSKGNFNEDTEIKLEKLDNFKTQCDNIKQEIETLNTKYKVLEKRIDTLIDEQHAKIVTLTDKHITTKDNMINQKIEHSTKSLDDMKTKLNSLKFNDDIRKNENVEIQGKIQEFEKMVQTIEESINKNKTKIYEIKGVYDVYKGEFNEEKNKSTKIVEKKNSMEKVYNKMEDTLKKLEDIDNEKNILNEIEKAEVLYRKVFIHNTVHMMDNETKKSKNLMDQIELSKREIEETKKQMLEYKNDEVSNYDYMKYYNQATESNAKIKETFKNATDKKEKAENIEKVSEIDDIKNQVNHNLHQIQSENSSIEEMLKQINNMKDLLKTNSSKGISDTVLSSTKNAEEFGKQAISEFNKTNDVIQAIRDLITKAEAHKNLININLEDEKINAEVKEIEKIKEQIANKKEEIESHLSKAKEFKEKCSSETSNAKRGKSKIEFLQSREGSSEEVDMKEIEENITKAEGYLNQAIAAETEANKNVELFGELQKNICDIFDESSILGIETTSKKKINKATEIMEEIKRKNFEIQGEVKIFHETLVKLKETHPDNNVDAELNNAKSTNANVLIQTNLEMVEHNLSVIAKIKQEGENIYNRASSTINSMTEISKNTEKKTLDKAKSDESKYISYLTKITSERDLIIEERNKLNGFDLKEYVFNKNINDYEQKMKEIHDKYDKSINKISKNLKKAEEDNTNYTLANELRKEAQQEKAELTNIQEEVNKYLRDIKKWESFRFILDMKDNLSNINTLIKQEELKVNDGYEYIKQLVDNIKESNDESSISDNLQKGKEKNVEIQNKMQSTYKNKAKVILGHIIDSAKFIDINIITKSPLNELSSESHLMNAGELKFQQENKVTLETEHMTNNKSELDVYKNIRDAYNIVVEIIAYSDKIDTKQRQSTQLLDDGNDIYLTLKSINELKNKINSVKSKENAISGKIDNISNKLNELNKITCDDKSYDNILDIIKHTELKTIRDSFKQEKINKKSDSKLEKIKEEFENSKNTLKNIEEEVNALKASLVKHDNIQSRNKPIDDVLIEIEKTEKGIDSFSASLDEMLKKGRECEIFRYTSIKDGVIAKINDDAELIDNIHNNTNEYLTYVQKNYSETAEDVRTLNQHFMTETISDHAPTNYETSNKSYEEITEAVNNSKAIIDNIQNSIIQVNEKTEISSLENSAEKIEKLYKELQDKKNTINEIYKKANIVKLQEIKSDADKYLDVANIFNNVLDGQKSRIINNLGKIAQVKETINLKLKKLVETDNTFTTESINRFGEIYNDIKTSIDELEIIEQTNYSEQNDVKNHKEKITYLISRRETLESDLKGHEEDTNVKKLNANTLSEVNIGIASAKEAISNSEEVFKKLLRKIEENERLCNNNDAKNFISDIMQNIDDLNKRFTKNIPEREKLFEIEKDYI